MKKIILKQTPEDFIVEEVITLETKKTGEYAILKIKKINLNTLDVVEILRNELKIPRNFISFAGTKDKRAITTQLFSIKSIKAESINNIKNKNLNLEFLGYSNKPISLGLLSGNRFTITIPFKPKSKIEFIPNYFGEQRFSTNNIEIGKFIIKKQFKEASQLINQSSINQHLKNHQNDFIGAIKTLDKKLISLYINAYQSYLWNKAVVIYLKQKLEPFEYIEHESLLFPKIITLNKLKNIKLLAFPLVSFDTEFKNKLIEEIYKKILKEENISLHEFIIRQFPDQLPVTSERDIFAVVKNFKWENNKLTFELPKGTYATILIKFLEVVED